MKKGLGVIIYLLYIAGYYYVMLPPMNWHAPEFWQFLVFCLLPLLVVAFMFALGKVGLEKFKYRNTIVLENSKWKRLAQVSGVMIVCIFLIPMISAGITSRFFHAKEYATRIEPKEVDFTEIPEVDFTKTPIIDRDSSQRLGDKVMGNMTEWVSQFDVSSEYTQVSYKDSVYRVTPLTYNGFIKYFKNRKEGIPAYITVDSTNGQTSLVKLQDLGLGGMKYVPSAMFHENLMRHLRFNYPTEIFGSPSFEVDEEGHPWYICTTYTYKGVGTQKKVTGAIFLDPISGKSKKYDVGEIPSWADRVYPESLLVEELDDNGSLQDGFINSKFGQNGVTVTSQGYNYLEKDGDIWLYSGITSANADESNLGFVLVNMRTHEAMKIKTAGANETSAMKSAEAEVKNYGYASTFPLLINVEGNPVYLMSLKDNGLIKMYAMVSAIDYQKVVTINSDEPFTTLTDKMLRVLGVEEKVEEKNTEEKKIHVSEIETAIIDGNTWYYLKEEDDKVYKCKLTSNTENSLVFLKVKTDVKIRYVSSDGIQEIIQFIQ